MDENASQAIIRYHERTKHHFQRYARSRGYMDWDNQPNPFRFYEGLTPLELLLELQAIEHAFYRQRDKGQKWGPRTMDLDILLFDQLQQHDSHLTIPHPEMKNRLFVLEPLKEIAGDLYIPRLGSLEFLITNAPPIRIQRIA